MESPYRRRVRFATTACILLAGLALCPTAQATRLPTAVRPTFQQIELRLDPDVRDYSGRVTVELVARERAASFSFHAEGLTIDTLVLSNAAGLLPVDWEQQDSATIAVRPAAALGPGTYQLDVAFRNTYDTQAVSLYRMESDGRGYLFSQMEEDDAREAFPCWDEPSFKFPYQVVLNVPETQLAVTNMPIESETSAGGWKRLVFEPSKPMPSYLLAFAVGPFDTVPIPGMPVPGRVITVRGKGSLAAEAVRSTPPILAALERYFDSPYPYPKLDLIAAPEFWPGAMENPGAIIYAEALLLPDPTAMTVRQRRSLASTTAHELAHMWFGDLVTMAWWDDLWLNESFATWMANKIVQELHPEYAIDVSAVQRMQEVLGGDARPSSRPVRQPIDETSDLLGNIGVIYQKGQAVLAMFEQWLGESTFRDGIQLYLERHAWANATADDLFRALEQASNRKVARAMSTFIDQPGAPLIEVVPLGDGRIRFDQRRFSNYGVEAPASKPWYIPVQIAYRAGSADGTYSFELTDSSATVDLGVGDSLVYLFPQAGARGYYRWSVPADMLRYMASQSTQIMTPSERVAYLGNVSALLDAGKVGGDVFLDAIHGFARDPDPQVITSVLDALTDVEFAFVPDTLLPSFARYVRATLGPALERFGMTPAPGEGETVTMLRPRLIGRLADKGRDPAALALVDSVFARYMADPTSVDPEIVGVAVGLACRSGDRALFDTCRQRFESAAVPAERSRFLAALGSFEDPEIQKAALAYSLGDQIRPQEVLSIPGSIARLSDRNADRVFEWVMANYAILAGRMPPVYRSFMPYFAGGCSRERLEAARLFFAEPEHQAPGIETQLARLADQVSDCVSLREREGARVAAYLTRFGPEAR